MKYERKSFIDGMWFSKDLIRNLIQDKIDQNPMLEELLNDLSELLCDEIWDNRSLIEENEDMLWGGQKIEWQTEE